jgi:hypothetical protein
MATLKAPFGASSDVTIAATGTTALTITSNETYNSVLPTLTGNATLDLTLSSELKAGARLYLKVKTTGSETFTFGTGIDAPVVTGSAGKTWTQGFWYDGTIFLPMGARIQID